MISIFFQYHLGIFIVGILLLKCDAFLIVRERNGCFLSTLSLSTSQGFGNPSSSSSKNAKSKTNSKKKKSNNSNGDNNVRPPQPPPTPYIPDVSETTIQLLGWLDAEEVEGLEGIEVGFSSSPRKSTAQNDGTSSPPPLLRGVFAKRDFQAGEYVCAVPFVTTILINEEFQPNADESDHHDDDDNNDKNKLLLASKPDNGLLLQKRSFEDQQQRNRYTPYFNSIPLDSQDDNFDATPDFWTTEEIQQLEYQELIQTILGRKNDIERLVVQQQQQQQQSSSSSYIPSLQHCCWMAQTRAFTTFKRAMDLDGTEGLLSRVVLIPLLDYLNHRSQNNNAELHVVETKEYDESFYALIATEPIRKGSQITIRYGTGSESSIDIYTKYGFLPEDGNQTNDDEILPEKLNGVQWSTTLEDDKAMLEQSVGNMAEVLKLRIFMKEKLQKLNP
jgi:hypothetical protein